MFSNINSISRKTHNSLLNLLYFLLDIEMPVTVKKCHSDLELFPHIYLKFKIGIENNIIFSKIPGTS